MYHWVKAWESRRLCGLYARTGRGRPPKLTAAHHEQMRQWAKDFPSNLPQSRRLIHDKVGLDVRKDTGKNVLQCRQVRGHRIRRLPTGAPDAEESQQNKQA
jgi:transposase